MGQRLDEIAVTSTVALTKRWLMARNCASAISCGGTGSSMSRAGDEPGEHEQCWER